MITILLIIYVTSMLICYYQMFVAKFEGKSMAEEILKLSPILTHNMLVIACLVPILNTVLVLSNLEIEVDYFFYRLWTRFKYFKRKFKQKLK